MMSRIHRTNCASEMGQQKHTRAGRSRLETILVLSAGLLVLGLSLPAVLKARETVRQQTSVRNMKRMGEKVEIYVATFGRLPSQSGKTASR